ncbi:MAG: GNAT family N-acetyltransferase [Gemmatimonadota bacterium]|nr:GNAT family N-acetyltransferase [Gemmatimonadota bacterium]
MRSWRREDAASLVTHANDRAVWLNLRDHFPHPYTPAHADLWLTRAAAADPETNFAIAVDDEAVGGIGFVRQADVHRRTAEVGYWLGRPHWGRGLASGAVDVLSAYAFASHELDRLFASVFSWNAASMKVLEKAGYVREGILRRSVVKDGHILDAMLYARLRD